MRAITAAARPIVDVWRRDAGLAVGHVESHPRLVALPIDVTAEGAGIAVDGETEIKLAPGDVFGTPQTFVAVHRGDHFATLATYREVMADEGLRAPKPTDGCYESVWCAWGYDRNFTVEQVVATLPKARELGLVWAGVDDGWQTSEGDWYLDPKKFPRGDADMIALVQGDQESRDEAQAVGRAARRRSRHRHPARRIGHAAPE